MTQKFCI